MTTQPCQDCARETDAGICAECRAIREDVADYQEPTHEHLDMLRGKEMADMVFGILTAGRR